MSPEQVMLHGRLVRVDELSLRIRQLDGEEINLWVDDPADWRGHEGKLVGFTWSNGAVLVSEP